MRASAAPSATPGPKRCWSRWVWAISSGTAPTSFPVASSNVFPSLGHWNPAAILADEPTGALDSHTGREVLGMLQQMHDEGHTVVLITHDNSIAVQADRIIRLEDGRVVYDGDAHAPEAVVQPTLLPDEEEKA